MSIRSARRSTSSLALRAVYHPASGYLAPSRLQLHGWRPDQAAAWQVQSAEEPDYLLGVDPQAVCLSLDLLPTLSPTLPTCFSISENLCESLHCSAKARSIGTSPNWANRALRLGLRIGEPGQFTLDLAQYALLDRDRSFDANALSIEAHPFTSSDFVPLARRNGFSVPASRKLCCRREAVARGLAHDVD